MIFGRFNLKISFGYDIINKYLLVETQNLA